MSRFVVTGNYSDSPVAYEMGELLHVPVDIADTVSLKTFANTEFCPRYIPDLRHGHRVGQGLEGFIVIIASCCNPGISRNDLAMRNLILARAAKDNGAARVILVEPDLFYSAQDRGPHRYATIEAERPDGDLEKFDGQPFTALLYAQALKLAGVDSVITVHNHSRKVQALFCDIFEDDFHNLIPVEVYAHYIRTSDFVRHSIDGDNLVLVAPDEGALMFVNLVCGDLGYRGCKRLVMDKKRAGEREVSMSVSVRSECGIEELNGKDVIIFDDMVRTGTTIVNCAQLLRAGNPRRVCFCVTHFQPSDENRENLNSRLIDEILTTSTIPAILNRDSQGRLRHKLAVLKIGKFMSRYILQLLRCDDGRFSEDFYAVDMSSQNPRSPSAITPSARATGQEGIVHTR
jgi:ribose-phosphate pyrophosphokinase